ncbi:M20/M25/M40 family metallo-hydrolase [Micromonospora sp. WMMD1082]|uniref:M20 family metallopeptidase n=1 Tax=Micromonospora sp. WMMD1082 TaxID=3016104 RepID=UPI002416DE86|nr:M20/M25/M40 family metallo-hydrolase [Micromonospora sp. WMMD1082]MDG4795143.1 M20/M25/M40 family metallo-hydrolase [Micromonospora sp. WMMD1082]
MTDPVWEAARDDHASVMDLAGELVRIPSRGGLDSYEPVVNHLADWLGAHGLAARRLRGPSGEVVAVACEVHGARPGPRYVLDACLDTAPFGAETAWTRSPVSGAVVDGWLHGRGSADSKAAVAIFAHIGARLRRDAERMHGAVTLLFDVDEHTGGFGGAKAYFTDPATGPVAGVMIGYPGPEHVVIGGRGVLRARLHVHGVAGHSGGSRPTPNAIVKAAAMVQALAEADLPGSPSAQFPPPPRVTVTAVSGGEGYSVVPDLCTLNIDIRLTPSFDHAGAEKLLRGTVDDIDARWPETAPTSLELVTRWPPYRLPDTSPLLTALLRAASRYGSAPQPRVAGPSNIGNYLAGLGIPATAGYGVDYVGLHGTDERIRIQSITPVQAVYHRALMELLPIA